MKKFILSLFLSLALLVNIRSNCEAKIYYRQYVGVWSVIEYIPLHPIYPTLRPIEVEPEYPEVSEVNIVNHSGMKSWMPWDVFDESSNQYKLQQYAETDSDGFRSVAGRYCVAVGSAVGADVGQFIDVVLENGEIIPAIVADVKADGDTNADNITTTANGCVCEFLINYKTLNHDVKKMGDTSAYDITWNSPIVKFIVYEEVNFLGGED